MSYSLGVDLGATTCSVAIRRGPDIEPCAIGETETTMPAVALPRADGSMLVGEAADQRSRYEPTLAAREVSARLGEPGPIVLDSQTADPLALTEALIGTVIQRASGPGEWPGHLVLTHPLRLGPAVEELLDQAAARVTTSEVMLVPEPIAAMAKLAHDVELAQGTTAVVIDFGGSSFDVTLVRRTETGFDLIGEPASLSEFGGFDVDNAVLAHVEEMLGVDVATRVDIADHEGMFALRRLRAACRAAKEELSSVHETVINVDLPDIQTQVAIARDDLERGIGAALAEAVDLVATIVADAGLTLSDLHVALVVGGSSRIPLLSHLITERIGLPIVADPLPELTVSLGAALFADEDPPEAGPAIPVPLSPPVPLAPPMPDPVTVPPAPVLDSGPHTDPGFWGLEAPEPTGLGSDQPWADARTSVFDDVQPGAGAAAGAVVGAGMARAFVPPMGDEPGDPFLDYGVGHEPDGADEAFRQLTTADSDPFRHLDPGDSDSDPFRQLTTSDTDPFGTRSGSGSLSGMRGRSKSDHHDDDRDAPLDPKPRGFGDSTDPRLIVGAIGAGLAIVLLGGFALAAGTGGGGNDDPAIAINDPLSTVATTTTLSTSAPTEAVTSSEASDTTSQPRTTTRPRTSTTRPRPTTTPTTAPPDTTPQTTPTTPSTSSSTTSSTTSTTQCPPTSTTTSTTTCP
jgi:actin-like ATPase involved in cell morphogenesis